MRFTGTKFSSFEIHDRFDAGPNSKCANFSVELFTGLVKGYTLPTISYITPLVLEVYTLEFVFIVICLFYYYYFIYSLVFNIFTPVFFFLHFVYLFGTAIMNFFLATCPVFICCCFFLLSPINNYN